MLRPIRCALSIAAGAAMVASASTASAQWFSSSSCGCAQPVVQTQCMQRVPITQQVMQKVAVTEYQQVKHKVRRPVTDVEYIEQPVTTYRPVVETRTRDVPVTTYQNVTECQTVQRDLGGWQTSYQRVNKVTPCEYDRRPNLLGWWNRTAYSIRQSILFNFCWQTSYSLC